MAVTSSGNTEVKTVLEVSTGNSPKSIKELRQQIKELRDELVGLDKGSQEYADTIAVLGDKTNDLKELMGDISRTNTDFGTTVSNVSNVLSGGVAAVQGLTAGLSLLGVEMGDENKLMQTLVKSMALLQSLGTMDKAIKSFKALSLVMKSNVAAAGGLTKALKALAISNPFTAILAAATAVLGVFTAITNASKRAAEESKQHWEDMASQVEQAFADTDTLTKYFNLTEQYSMQWQKAGEDSARRVQQLMDTYGGSLEWATEKAIQELDELRKKAIQDHQDWLKTDYMLQMAYLSRSQQAAVNALESLQNIYGGWNKQQEDAKKKADEEAKRAAENAKRAAEDRKNREKALYDLALKRLQLQKTLDDTEINARYEEEKRAAQGNAEQLLAIEEKYQTERKILNENYYKNAIALAEEYMTKVKDPAEQVALQQTIANLNQQIQEGTDEWKNYKIENEAARKEMELTRQQLEAEIKLLDQEAERLSKNAAIQNTFNRETIEYLDKANEKYGIFASSFTTYYEQERAFQQQLLELEQQHADLLQDRGNLDSQLQQLQSQYEQGLIAYDEYERQKAEIRKQYAEVNAQLDENEVQQEDTKLKRKIELNQAYRQAIGNITSDLVNLLNTMADAEGVSFEDSKKMKIAAATISTIQGSINAFMGYLDSGIPQPMASILGGIAAASTLAMGMAQIQKIKNTKPGNGGNVSASTAAIQTVTAPTQMTNITGFSDNITLPDTRVFIVYDDIAQAGNRVNVVTNNSEI